MSFSVIPASWDVVEPGGLDLGTPLGACCHGSRLLGRESSFVLHGGGNTSVKSMWNDITGRDIESLYVKRSGWNLATIEPAGFTPLRMSRLHELLELDSLSDENMARELAAAKLDPAAPAPSVESLLHGFLPFTAVQHSHADAIVALTNTSNGEANVRDVFGDDVVVIPYVMPGFDLARLVHELWPQRYRPGMTGMVLLNHGLFTFADDTRSAYERHMELIVKAQEWIAARPEAKPKTASGSESLPSLPSTALATIRQTVSAAAGRPMIVTRHADSDVAEFLARPDHADLATCGPLTPDHIIRTKRLPQIGTNVDGYVADYKRYFDTNATRSGRDLMMLDPAPRVILDPDLGMLSIGASVKDSAIVEDIYRHTIETITTVEDRLGGYVALDQGDLFDTEYWDLEQAKLRRSGSTHALGGQVALVTGAASGIGRACVTALLDAGAAVIGLDIAQSVTSALDNDAFFGTVCDVTDSGSVDAAIATGVERFGGIDIAIVAAGVFPDSQMIADLEDETWRRAMTVNLDSVAFLLRSLHPLLALSPTYGRVVIIGSKNAGAPGPGASAYSVSKAGLTQLARLSALEWADDQIRVNIVHPDAVFDTGLWSPELLQERADKYGMTVDEYKTRNLLGTEVTSETVADLAVALCGRAFAATTGAQVPVDGGNDRII